MATQSLPSSTPAVTAIRLWCGRIISALAVLLFVMDGVMKVMKTPASVQFTAHLLGYPERAVAGIGATLLLCTLLYAVPRTSVLGAVLLTGYLGGAAASNIRIEAPAFNVGFPIVFALFAWLGLWLRKPKLQELLPFTAGKGG